MYQLLITTLDDNSYWFKRSGAKRPSQCGNQEAAFNVASHLLNNTADVKHVEVTEINQGITGRAIRMKITN